MSGQLITVVLTGLVYALILAAGLRRPSDQEVDRWIEAYGAPPDEGTRALATRYLTRTRRIRFMFAIGGITAGRLVVEGSPGWVDVFVFGLAGYLVGSVLVEMVLSRPETTEGPTAAALSPRSVASYLPRYALVLIAATPIAGAAAALWQMDIAAEAPARIASIDQTPLVGAALFMIILAIGVIIAVRWIARRPQPASSVEMVAVDDAFRSSSIHALAGAAITLDLLLLSYILSRLQNALSATGSRFSTTVAFLSLLVFAMTIAAWVIIGHPSRWRSRRPLGSTATASAVPRA